MNITNGVSLRNVPLYGFEDKSGFYYDNLCTFDIEVSTGFFNDGKLEQFDRKKPTEYYKNLKHYSLMYLWNMSIDGYLFSGRSLDDLLSFFEGLNDILHGTLYCYIHNASYEFQFLRNILREVDVFAREKRKPLKFTWKNIEFRCSYMLTRLSLDRWGIEKNLEIKKITGVYDYSKLRTPLTTLSIIERDYGYNDVLVGVCGLEEYRQRYKHVKYIPITQTACVRKEVNKAMRDDYRARKKVADMTDISLETYRFLVQCFMGGYTHANVLFANRVINGMWDFDISSSYPWAMLSEKYPMTRFIKTDNYIRYMSRPDKYCYAMRVELTGVHCRYFNTYISISKCEEYEKILLDNGRILSAKRIVTCILDVDWEIIKKAYEIKSYRIMDFYYAVKGYLSDSLRREIVALYGRKTTLKNNPEKFTLMYKSKEEINALYGIGVTKVYNDEITYINSRWDKDLLTEEKYNEKRDKNVKNISKLNVGYGQGIYVPAYGRRNLWHMVHLFDDEIAYMDTDSVKCVHDDDILMAMDEYNGLVHDKQRKLAQDLGLSYDDFNPRDFKGEVHSIGTYERDKDIARFKTLGAKRYICEYDMSTGLDYLKMTVSGVRKKAVYQLATIDDFNDSLIFDIDNAEKLLLLYNDEQEAITWNKGQYDEWHCADRYGISSYNIPYKISMSMEYLALIRKVREDATTVLRKNNAGDTKRE